MAVYWFPEGFTPRGWGGMETDDSSISADSNTGTVVILLPLGCMGVEESMFDADFMVGVNVWKWKWK